MRNGISVNRIKGFKGELVLFNFKDFDIVVGCFLDYMYGVLLGVIKFLLYKWLFLIESKKFYFVGKSLKIILKRMIGI